MKKTVTFLLSLFTLSAVAATDPKAAYEMVQKNQAVIVDVREEDEIKSGMIKNAEWFPMSKVLNNKNWKEDFEKLIQGKKVFLHCRTGRRSERVMNILKSEGIKSENIGGYEQLKHQLPTRELGQK